MGQYNNALFCQKIAIRCSNRLRQNNSHSMSTVSHQKAPKKFNRCRSYQLHNCDGVRSHIDWRGGRNIFYKGVETSPQQTHSKTVRLTTIHNRPKRTISTSGGLGQLQMVSELDTGQCASEEARPLRGVSCKIPHRLEKGTSANEDAKAPKAGGL